MSYIVPAAGMLLTQTAAAMTLVVVPVLATEIALSSGVDSAAVGPYTSLIFVMAMLSSSLSGTVIQRTGPVRANQLALVGSAIALLLTISAHPWLVALSALALGFAYGANTPSGSQVLARVTPANRRALVFSLKQSGATAGAVLAGIMLPMIAVRFDWQSAVMVASALVVLAAIAVQPLRRVHDAGSSKAAGARGADPFAAARKLFANRALRVLTLGAVLTKMLYITLQTFMVAYLVDDRGWGLEAAGVCLALFSGAGTAARIMLGWLADRLRATRSLLSALAFTAALTTLVLMLVEPSWSEWLVWSACLLAGASSAGWYGVFLAEIIRAAPGEEAATATGGALFFVYGAIVTGPLLFGALVVTAGGYQVAWFVFALMGLGAAVVFARIPVPGPRPPPGARP